LSSVLLLQLKSGVIALAEEKLAEIVLGYFVLFNSSLEIVLMELRFCNGGSSRFILSIALDYYSN
jgi:hypothetical protein